jgi:radical SAM superfamily enzyme YgiQ (UPF0313 family)
MRVLLIYPARIAGEQPLGLMYVSAVLKEAGHQVKIWLPHPLEWFFRKYFLTRQSLSRGLDTFRPDLVGFSVISTEYHYSLILADFIKKKQNVPIVFGGPHPSVDPEGTIENPLVGFICIGEGEYPMLELVEALEGDRDVTRIQNIWAKVNGKVYRNEIRPLVSDLDELPFPDREALPAKYYLNEDNGASFITSRGCPYKCTYCINQNYQEQYRGKGRWTRYRSIDNVFAEIKEVISRYGIRKVTFSDETFTVNKRRTVEFLQRYREEIGLPFLCQTRPDVVDSEMWRVLKEAGCSSANIGIETGNDYLRNKILKRNLSREQIVNAFRAAKEDDFTIGSFNMVGVPYETEETIWETIELNREVKPNWTLCTVFMPLPGSELRTVCEEKGWIADEIDHSYYSTVTQRLPGLTPAALLSYAFTFDLYVRVSRRYFPIVHLLRRAYALIFAASQRGNFVWLVRYGGKLLNGILLRVFRDNR